MGNPMVTLVVAMESGRWLSTGMSNVSSAATTAVSVPVLSSVEAPIYPAACHCSSSLGCHLGLTYA